MNRLKLIVAFALTLVLGAGAAAADDGWTEAQQAALAQVDHYRCYQADQRDPQLQQALLRDVFLSGARQIRAVAQICAPVRKIRPNLDPPENLAPQFPLAHLVCYQLRPRDRADASVEIANQFEKDRAEVGEERVLCVPSLKRHLPLDATDGFPSREEGEAQLAQVDHYRCYRARQRDPQEHGAILQDQFLGPDGRRVRHLVSLCTPVQKVRPDIGEELNPLFPRVSLACYALRPRDTADDRVRVWNQFESDDLAVGEERTLCVPSLMRPVESGA